MQSKRLHGWSDAVRVALLASAILSLPFQSARAQAPQPASADGEQICPPVPEVLTRRWAMTGILPEPTAEDLTLYRKYVAILQATDWAYLCRYSDANRVVMAGPRPRIVFMGDSITEFWKQRDPGFFTDDMVDRGIGGQTSSQMVVRFYADVIALRPRTVHIMAGINDIAENSGHTSDAQYRNNIMTMVELAQAHNIRVILASILPAKSFPWRPGLRPPERIRVWNDWLRRYAEAQGLTYVDYHAAMSDGEGGLKAGYGNDGVHPTQAGYQPMDTLFRSALAAAERR